MPELPEVETVKRGIEPHLVGTNILRTIVRRNSLRWPISKEIFLLKNKLILSIQRRARYLLLEMLNGWIIIHLGMSGKLNILTEERFAKKHDHIDLIISNNKVLRYTDPRRFGFWLWIEKLEEYNVLMEIGPEPLSEVFNAKYLYNKCIKNKRIIKSYLMDNKLVAGIGNIYASESLFHAGIHPNRLSNTLSIQECELLVKSIKNILKFSIEKGGTTFKDFFQVNGKSGSFDQELKVYGRKNKPCLVCKEPILTLKNNCRTTFYCQKCQK